MKNKSIGIGLTSLMLVTGCGEDITNVKESSSDGWNLQEYEKDIDMDKNTEDMSILEFDMSQADEDMDRVINDMREDYKCVIDVTDIEGYSGFIEANEPSYDDFHIWINVFAIMDRVSNYGEPSDCYCVAEKVYGEVFGTNYAVSARNAYFEESGILPNGNVLSNSGFQEVQKEGDKNLYSIEPTNDGLSLSRVQINFNPISVNDVEEDVEIFNSYKVKLGETNSDCVFRSSEGFVKEFSRSVSIVLK